MTNLQNLLDLSYSHSTSRNRIFASMGILGVKLLQLSETTNHSIQPTDKICVFESPSKSNNVFVLSPKADIQTRNGDIVEIVRKVCVESFRTYLSSFIIAVFYK